MTRQQRFLEIARFRLKGEVFLPSCFQPLWHSTKLRWYKEGLPEDIYIPEYFEFDRTDFFPVNTGVYPPFEKEVLKEDAAYMTIIDFDGVKKKILKENRKASMDQWLQYPVKDKKTWNEYKKRLDPTSPLRFGSWWNDEKDKYKDRTYPIGIQVGSFFGWLRNLIGIENLSYMMNDNPVLIEEINEYIEYFILTILKKVLKDVQIDFAHYWEDMAYKTGSLVSMRFVKKYMVPHYLKINDYLHSNGIDIINLDSDGNIWELIPIWLDCGINALWPNEVAAGMDVVEMRKKFGKNLILAGGIDKRVLVGSKRTIEEEVKRKAGFLLKEGGYFPGIDHSVPHNVPLKNFLYYLEILKKGKF